MEVVVKKKNKKKSKSENLQSIGNESTEPILQKVPSFVCQTASIPRIEEESQIFAKIDDPSKITSFEDRQLLEKNESLKDKFSELPQLIVKSNEKQRRPTASKNTILVDIEKMADEKKMIINAKNEINILMYSGLEAPSAPPVDLEELDNNISLKLPKIKDNQTTIYPVTSHLVTTSSEEVNTINTTAQKFQLLLNDDQLLQNIKLQSFTSAKLKEYYNCNDLEMVSDFEDKFVEEYSPPELSNSMLQSHPSSDFKQDTLYQLLTMYHSYKTHDQMNLMSLDCCQKEAFVIQEKIWVKTSMTKTFSGRCGDNVNLKETVTFDFMEINPNNYKLAETALEALFDMAQNAYNLQLRTAIIKAKIDELIEKLITSIKEVLTIDELIVLHLEHSSDSVNCIARLRKALQILFYFIRKPTSNKNITRYLREWLDKIVAVFLRLATKEDHWFIIMHLLRCPNGVGEWGNKYIQLPTGQMVESQFDTTKESMKAQSLKCDKPLQLCSPEINLYLSVLKIILMPIKQRNNYLKAFTDTKEIDAMQNQHWTFIDVDGDDVFLPTGEYNAIKETDLIAFIKQVPFAELFKSALGIEQFLGDYIINKDTITSQRMLSILAFFNQLTDVLGLAQQTYNLESHKQFAKHLTGLLKHTLQYATNYYILYRTNSLSKDIKVLSRLVVEYHALLLKICRYIYAGRNLSTWQYFGLLPYEYINLKSLWELFYYMNVGFPEEFVTPNEDYKMLLKEDDFWTKFNIMHADTSHENLYYLLQTFRNMAIKRDKQNDWELIQTIAQHIFYIGFININTHEICYKAARDILVDLTNTHQELFLVIFSQTKDSMNANENVFFLYKFLPIEKWQPNLECFEILSDWLTHYDITSKESRLARLIISRLNWNFGNNQQSLFLDHRIHLRMACSINEALTKHAPETIGISGVSENVLQLSNFIDYSQTSKKQFTIWCWSMVSKFHLHLMDQSVNQIKYALQNPAEALATISSLELITNIYQDVLEKRPLAIYLALLMSWHGHSIPWICQKGFDLMQSLIKDYRHATVIRSLQLIIPLFLECPDVLSNCESFYNVLTSLLNADQTYLKLAKGVINGTTVGPVLRLFESMLIYQITSYQRFGFTSPLNFINIWLHCLTKLPNWQNTNAVYLLEQILRMAYQFPDVQQQVVNYMENYCKDYDKWKVINKKNSLMSLFSSVSISNEYKLPEISPNYPWIALLLLEIEFKQVDSVFWPNFLHELSTAGSKCNLEVILKKTVIYNNCAVFPVEMLCLYKLAKLIATMDPKHILFPIVNQKFFEIYLYRVLTAFDKNRFQQVYGVSNIFYDFNTKLMKKMKNNLLESQTYHASEAKSQAKKKSLSFYHRSCENLMKTFVLWLEDPAINKLSLEHENYPAQYNPEKLKEIFSFSKAHWTEYLYFPLIHEDQRQLGEEWAVKCLRSDTMTITNKNALCLSVEKPSSELEHGLIKQIKSQLQSYDVLIQAPSLNDIIRNSFITDLKSLTNLNDITAHFNIVTEIVRDFQAHKEYCTVLCNDCMHNIKKLYRIINYVEVKRKACKGILFRDTCTLPTQLHLQLTKSEKDDIIQNELDQIHCKISEHIRKSCNNNCQKFAWSTIYIENFIKLITTPCSDKSSEQSRIKMGLHIFYQNLNYINKMENINLGTVKQFYIEIFHSLKDIIISEQSQNAILIVQCGLEMQSVAKLLEDVFKPNQMEPSSFVKLYEFLINLYDEKDCSNNVRLQIISFFDKFNINEWLNSSLPNEHYIDNLLELIIKGLELSNNKLLLDKDKGKFIFEMSSIHDRCQKHLVDIFQYKFPLYYIKVLQLILERLTIRKISSKILLVILNELIHNGQTEVLESMILNNNVIPEWIETFAQNQKRIKLTNINEGISLFTTFFKKQKLQKEKIVMDLSSSLTTSPESTTKISNLYVIYYDYYEFLTYWFQYFGQCLVMQVFFTYKDALCDQICDITFGSIIELYSPWLIPYSLNIIRQQLEGLSLSVLGSTSDQIYDILNLLEGDKCGVVQPWEQSCSNAANSMMSSFIKILSYAMQKIPISERILSHTFAWYIHHFSIANIQPYVYSVINKHIIKLCWKQFKPSYQHITLMYEALLKMIPQINFTIGKIFICIDWNIWFGEIFHTNVTLDQQTTIVSQLFSIFIRISFLPDIHNDECISRILENALDYPWHLINSYELEELFKWFKMNIDPSIVLKNAQNTNNIDRAVLDLLRVGSAMSTNRICDIYKRFLYVRTILDLQVSAVSMNSKLLTQKKGIQQVKTSFEELLKDINHSLELLSGTMETAALQSMALDYMREIIKPMQTQPQEFSNLKVECIIKWQTEIAHPGDILMHSIFYALDSIEIFITSTYQLLDSTIQFYFCFTEGLPDNHKPTWSQLASLLHNLLPKLQLIPIIHGNYFHLLHIFLIYKIHQMKGHIKEQVTFLQDICQLLDGLKSNQKTEPELALVWCAIIVQGCLLLKNNSSSERNDISKALNMMAKYLQSISNEDDTWGKNILGAIGIGNKVSIERKILSRCLAIFIYSILSKEHNKQANKFNSVSSEELYASGVRELSMLLNHRRYTEHKPLIVQSVTYLKEFPGSFLPGAPQHLSNLLKMFYQCPYFMTTPEVWQFDFKFND